MSLRVAAKPQARGQSKPAGRRILPEKLNLAASSGRNGSQRERKMGLQPSLERGNSGQVGERGLARAGTTGRRMRIRAHVQINHIGILQYRYYICQ